MAVAVWIALWNDHGTNLIVSTERSLGRIDTVRELDQNRLKHFVQIHNMSFVEQRKLCEDLVNIAKADPSADNVEYSSRHCAFLLLVNYVDHTVSDVVIDFLIENIAFRDPLQNSYLGLPSPEQLYPALASLLKIGRAATARIILKARGIESKGAQALISHWFAVCLGKRFAIIVLDDYLQDHYRILSEAERSRLRYIRDECLSSRAK